MYVGCWGGVHGFRWERSIVAIARPKAKEEKKRKKSFQKIELSGFSLPSSACSQIFA